MDLNIQIPDNTASIFEYLQKGLFISSNSTSEEVRDMYNEIDEIERVLILTDGCKIPLDDVVDIESNLLRDMF